MPNVLVVDDEEAVAQTIEHALRREYEVWVVYSAVEALKVARRVSPDLIILDIMMPGMNGLQACRELRRDPMLKSVPFSSSQRWVAWKRGLKAWRLAPTTT